MRDPRDWLPPKATPHRFHRASERPQHPYMKYTTQLSFRGKTIQLFLEASDRPGAFMTLLCLDTRFLMVQCVNLMTLGETDSSSDFVAKTRKAFAHGFKAQTMKPSIGESPKPLAHAASRDSSLVVKWPNPRCSCVPDLPPSTLTPCSSFALPLHGQPTRTFHRLPS